MNLDLKVSVRQHVYAPLQCAEARAVTPGESILQSGQFGNRVAHRFGLKGKREANPSHQPVAPPMVANTSMNPRSFDGDAAVMLNC